MTVLYLNNFVSLSRDSTHNAAHVLTVEITALKGYVLNVNGVVFFFCIFNKRTFNIAKQSTHISSICDGQVCNGVAAAIEHTFKRMLVGSNRGMGPGHGDVSRQFKEQTVTRVIVAMVVAGAVYIVSKSL